MERSLIEAIERALRGLEYGSLQLVVHEGQLVRIERIERIRLTDPVGSPLITTIARPTPTREDRARERIDQCSGTG